jgi:hypothetical protein
MFWFCFIAVLAGLFWAMFRLTRKVELQRSRLWRIPLSVLPALIVSHTAADILMLNWGNPSLGGLAFIAAIVALGIIWCGPLADAFSVGFSGALFGTHFLLTGVKPDCRFARIALRDGDFDEALELVQVELKKEPLNHETLLTLCEIQASRRDAGAAIATLDTILNNPASSEDQIAVARAWREQCAKLHAETEAERVAQIRK